MRLLTVTADDFGLHPDINRGVLDCARAGALSGVSVSVTGSAPDWPALREMRGRGIGIGLHLTFVGEPWLCGGRTFRSWREFAAAVFLGGPGFAAAVAAEARAQAKLLRANGFEPDRLDSHQHVHILPRVWGIVSSLASGFPSCGVRIPLAPPGRRSGRGAGYFALQRLAALRARARPGEPWCIGLAEGGHNSADRIRAELDRCSGHDAEFVAHPGVTTPDLQTRYRWGYDWSGERAMLLDPAFRQAITDAGYRMGTFGAAHA